MAFFYLPEELQRLINEFARPCTRPDWRQGSYVFRKAEELGFIDEDEEYYCSQLKNLLVDKYFRGSLAGGTIIVTNEHYNRIRLKWWDNLKFGLIRGGIV